MFRFPTLRPLWWWVGRSEVFLEKNHSCSTGDYFPNKTYIFFILGKNLDEASTSSCLLLLRKWSKVLTGQTWLIGSWRDKWPLIIVTYSFALTSISLKDFPFLYEISGGSLNISPSSGWFWIKCHLLIKMFLRLGNAGWYVVTKGRIFFRTFSFCCKADFRSVNLTSEVIFSIRLWG